MWFKKKSVLQAEGHYNSNTAADGTDWRTINHYNKRQTWSVSHTLPSAADAGNYFYLPALGCYDSGWLTNVGSSGHHWSSSAIPSNSNFAYKLSFSSGVVYVGSYYRYYGNRVGGFE